MARRIGNYIRENDYHPNLHQGEYPSEEFLARQGSASMNPVQDAKGGAWEKYIRDFQKNQDITSQKAFSQKAAPGGVDPQPKD